MAKETYVVYLEYGDGSRKIVKKYKTKKSALKTYAEYYTSVINNNYDKVEDRFPNDSLEELAAGLRDLAGYIKVETVTEE